MSAIATLLLIEDNPDIQALLQTVLAAQYTVLAATDGPSGLRRFGESAVDLVLLDLMLPGITGESVLKQIRQQADTPVLVLTALQDKAHIVALLNAGANDYLTKPFDLDELQARIRVQLRTQAPPTTLAVGELQLDAVTHAVTVGGRAVDLPKKEFALLALLMRHPHQVFEKAQLYQQVWQAPYLDGENTLNVHLSHLRARLNAVADQQYVTTVWGIGVRLL